MGEPPGQPESLGGPGGGYGYPGYPGYPGGYTPPAYGPPGYPPPQGPPGYPPPQGQPGYPPPGYSPPGYPPPGYPPPGYPPPGYPPPQGQPGYPPPGYPPPQGQPGYPPPGYPPPGPRLDVGDALSWSWNKFSRNTAELIVSLLGYAMLVAAIVIVWVLVFFGALSTDTAGALSPAQSVILFVSYLAALVAPTFVQAAYLSGCLDIADGRPVAIGSFFRPRNLGPALLTAVLVGLLVAIGTMLFIIPGLIVAFLAQFAIAFAVDRSLSPVDAFKASFATCRTDLDGALLSWLLQLAALLIGEMLCGVGLLVGFPLAVLIQTYTYRRLSGGWVAPARS